MYYSFLLLNVLFGIFLGQNDLMEWLHLLGLGTYLDTLCDQGYENMDDVLDITWEDLEEIGIQKLGELK